LKRTQLKKFVKSQNQKMIDTEKYMGSFKESITKRLDRHEDSLKNFSDKMKSFEITQREYKRRLSRLEDGRDPDKNEDIDLKNVKNFLIFVIFNLFLFL
jgi:hypothetical protein